MCGRVGAKSGEDPAVTAGLLGPRQHALIRLVPVGCEPADEQGREAADVQMFGSASYDSLRDLVRVVLAVAVRPASFRRHDVGGVARDEVEGLAGNRLEQAALPT